MAARRRPRGATPEVGATRSAGVEPPPEPEVRVVHEGRGGYVELEGRRYAIEHVGDGRFCIHFPGGQRHARLAAHRARLARLVSAEPERWTLGEG